MPENPTPGNGSPAENPATDQTDGFVVRLFASFRRPLRLLGPGLITGAADDDPSGIATYTQTEAQFGYGQLWTAVFMLPFLMAVQEACARIGSVTGKGLAAVVGEQYNRATLSVVVRWSSLPTRLTLAPTSAPWRGARV